MLQHPALKPSRQWLGCCLDAESENLKNKSGHAGISPLINSPCCSESQTDRMQKRISEDMILQCYVKHVSTDTEGYRLGETRRLEVRPVRTQRLRDTFAFTCTMARPRGSSSLQLGRCCGFASTLRCLFANQGRCKASSVMTNPADLCHFFI